MSYVLNFFKSSKFLAYIYLARLHRPIGIWLLLWPCFCGLAINQSGFSEYLIFFIGAVAMRSAGCIINDLVDKDFDAKVERTKNRPLAAKILTPKQAAFALLFFLIIGAGVWLQLSYIAKNVSLIAAGMMVIYPFMKRFTYWPQLFLGLTFNMGLWIACANDAWRMSWQSICFYCALVLWTVFYDTIYGFADIKDDQKANVKSTALLMQNAPKVWLSGINILSHSFLVAPLCQFRGLGLIGVFAGWVFLQILLYRWDSTNPENCLKTFGRCHFWGLGLWIFLIFIKIIVNYGYYCFLYGSSPQRILP